MTKIQPGRPIRRQTDALCSHFPILIELHPKHLTLRLKGQPKTYDLTWEHLYWHGMDMEYREGLRRRRMDRIARRAA